MKRYIVSRLVVLVLVITGILMSIGSYAMLHIAYIGFHADAYAQILQIEEILLKNDDNVDQLQEEQKADFLIRAKAAAYMIQYNQDIIYDINQLEHIIELLRIDEIHLFTPQGEIYSGNVPDYYGYSMDAGEQMQFFIPMLDNYELELAQEVTPNTAEGKEMQYVAVWSEDKQHIVQIGIEPLRLLEAMQETELSYIFSRLTHSADTTFFAVDAMSRQVISSTNQSINQLNISELGLSEFDDDDVGVTQYAKIENQPGHALLLKQSDNIYIGYFETNASVYGYTLVNLTYLIAVSLAIAILLILLIYHLLDKVVLRGLLDLEKGMGLIASGNLEHKMNVVGLPEFKVLSDNVNFMVKRVLESSRKFSTIIEHVNIPIAMYECKSDAVIKTGKLAEILHISNERLLHEFKSPEIFLAFIEVIMSTPHPNEKDVYILHTKNDDRFLKIMRYQDGESDWGLVLDVTDEITEKNAIKKERDLDFLTGLYGKRAFFEQINDLATSPNQVKKAIVIMFDLDNLKYVNDTWGHATGDKFIYAAASVLHRCEHELKICSRLSGDEFAMVLYGADDYSQLEHYLQEIKAQFAQTYIQTPTGEDHKVSASMGYSLYPEQNDSFKICLSLADKAMYAAKSKCKGSIEKYDLNNNYDRNMTNV